jgi:hypothetical protein
VGGEKGDLARLVYDGVRRRVARGRARTRRSGALRRAAATTTTTAAAAAAAATARAGSGRTGRSSACPHGARLAAPAPERAAEHGSGTAGGDAAG